MLNVVFRTDAGPHLGFGHLTRCRALAYALGEQGATCFMVGPAAVYRNHEDADLFREWHPVPEWVDEQSDAERFVEIARRLGRARAVLDDYRIQEDYQRVMLQSGIRWLQFDSFARQPFLGHWVLCASPSATPERYEPCRRQDGTRFLLGPRFAVIRTAFRRAHDRAEVRTRVDRVVLCFGGGNDRGATKRVLEALSPLGSGYAGWDVIIGGTNPYRAEIAALLTEEPYRGRSRLHVDSHEVVDLLSNADLGIISGGTISFEACAVGLPTVLLGVADNQMMNVDGWTRAGVSLSLGALDALEPERVREVVGSLCSDSPLLQAMSKAAVALVDAKGGERVAHELLAR